MFLPLKLIKKRVKFTYTYVELKIICKSKIVSLQLSLQLSLVEHIEDFLSMVKFLRNIVTQQKLNGGFPRTLHPVYHRLGVIFHKHCTKDISAFVCSAK